MNKILLTTMIMKFTTHNSFPLRWRKHCPICKSKHKITLISRTASPLVSYYQIHLFGLSFFFHCSTKKKQMTTMKEKEKRKSPSYGYKCTCKQKLSWFPHVTSCTDYFVNKQQLRCYDRAAKENRLLIRWKLTFCRVSEFKGDEAKKNK